MRVVPRFPVGRLGFEGCVSCLNPFEINRSHALPIARPHFFDDHVHRHYSNPCDLWKAEGVTNGKSLCFPAFSLPLSAFRLPPYAFRFPPSDSAFRLPPSAFCFRLPPSDYSCRKASIGSTLVALLAGR